MNASDMITDATIDCTRYVDFSNTVAFRGNIMVLINFVTVIFLAVVYKLSEKEKIDPEWFPRVFKGAMIQLIITSFWLMEVMIRGLL